MEFSWPLVLLGLLLGIFQLTLGVVIGRCLPVGGTKSVHSDKMDAGRLADFVLKTTAEILRITQRLQTRLRVVEEMLARQAEPISEESAASRSAASGAQTEAEVPLRALGEEADETELAALCEDVRARLAEVLTDQS